MRRIGWLNGRSVQFRAALLWTWTTARGLAGVAGLLYAGDARLLVDDPEG